MRHGLVLTAMLVSGCYAPPQDAGYGGYGQPGYPDASGGYGYAQPGYGYPAGYEATPYDPNYGYSGGAPTYIDNGVVIPLVLLGGSWGYYDSGRHWHRAPDDVSRHFNEPREDGHRREGAPPQFHQPPPGIGGEPNRPPQFHQPPPGIAGGPNPGPPPFHQFQQPPAGAIPAAAPRPPPPPARPEPHPGGRDCPPGQRC